VVADLSEEWAFHGYDYQKEFRGTHPRVMAERIGSFVPFLERRRSRWLNPRFYRHVLRHGFKG